MSDSKNNEALPTPANSVPAFVAAIDFPFAEVVAQCKQLARRYAGKTLVNETRQVVLASFGKEQLNALKDLLVTAVEAEVALMELFPEDAPKDSGWKTPANIGAVTANRSVAGAPEPDGQKPSS